MSQLGASGGTGVRVERLPLAGSDADLMRGWQELVDRDERASPFMTPDWTLAWQRHLGLGPAELLVARRGDIVLGVLPLVQGRLQRLGIAYDALMLAGGAEADRLGAVVAAGAPSVAGLAEALLQAGRAVDVLQLTELETGDPLERAIGEAVAQRRLRAIREPCSRAPVLRLDRPLAEIEAGYSGSLRMRLKRARQKQQRAGRVEFRRWLPVPEEVPDLLPQLRALEQRSWKGSQGVGIFGGERRWRFFCELSQRFATRRWLDVAMLRLDGRLIAYRYGFRFRNVFLDYSLSHDAEFDALSPGRVLLDEIVRDSHRLGLAAVDASRGRIAAPHLLADWTAESRWHCRWTVFMPSFRGRCVHFLERRCKPLWQRLRRRPATVALAGTA